MSRFRRADRWTPTGGCFERYEVASGRRVAFVNPEGSDDEWCWEITSEAGVRVFGEEEATTSGEACAQADDALRRLGWKLWPER